jgi:S-adenosylmethionine hydrolase
MQDPIITLTTDFGDDSPYVAALKGVILNINPSARLLDLSHQIPPQDIRYTSFFLAAAIPYFPPEVLHLIIVDPGVGTERALLFVEVAGHRLLAPDNGCWTELIRGAAQPAKVIRLVETRYWRPLVSPTFHGRDILAPVAGHLSLGLKPELLGPLAEDWVRMEAKSPIQQETDWRGEVAFVDHFGNLISNLPAEALPAALPCKICVQGVEIIRRVRSYAEADPGTLVILTSSVGLLEIAVVGGSAAKQLNATVGTPILAKRTMA